MSVTVGTLHPVAKEVKVEAPKMEKPVVKEEKKVDVKEAK